MKITRHRNKQGKKGSSKVIADAAIYAFGHARNQAFRMVAFNVLARVQQPNDFNQNRLGEVITYEVSFETDDDARKLIEAAQHFLKRNEK